MRRSLAAIVLGSAVLALVGVLPSPVGAQRTRPPYRVGVLNDARAANHPAVDGLKAGLRDLGFEEGRDVIFDVKLTDGDPERMPAAAGALARAGTTGLDPVARPDYAPATVRPGRPGALDPRACRAGELPWRF